MKIGEALTLRARQANRLNDLQGRIKASALVQEGDEPTEEIDDLITEYKDLATEHAALVRRIQISNMTTQDEHGESIQTLLTKRSVLVAHRNISRIVAQASSAGSNDRYRFTRSEIKLVPQVNAAYWYGEADSFDAEVRVIDARIQETNWKNDLLGSNE
jgi:hypothetical protein